MCLGELTDGQDFDLVLGVRDVRGAQVTFADSSGTLPGRLPEDQTIEVGEIVRVRGTFRDGVLLACSVRVEGPHGTAEQMEEDLRQLIATVQCEHLRALLDAVFAPGTETWLRYRTAPAAKRYHHPYRHGLLEHSLSVAQGVSAMAATFPGIDRDVAVTAALLHDIGKLDAYTSDPLAIELTDLGKLQGEIPLGYYRVRRLIEDLPGFPERTAAAVLHIILSHHGTHEHGSPVLPCTREATLVHMIDNLGGRLGSFDRLEKELPEGEQWSGFDRALSGSAWFGDRRAA